MVSSTWHCRSALKLSTPVMVALALPVLLALLTPAMAVEGQLKNCMKMDRHCRLKTEWGDIDGYQFVSLNISCFCEDDEPEEVWDYLNTLTTYRCTFLPTDDGMKVNRSTIHITGCFVEKEVFPPALMSLVRRTDHLEIVFNKCNTIRLGSIVNQQRKVPLFTASFSDSKLSGLPRGWLTAADRLVAKIDRCELTVVESRAVSGFSDNAEVQLEITDSNISTVKMRAFELPPSGSLTIKGGMVTSWEKQGYQGGSKVNLEDVRIGRLLGEAINLYGVTSFQMTQCTVAELLAKALTDQNRGTTRPPAQNMTAREALITHNTFMKANGEAFVNLCDFASIVWRNNIFVDIAEAPLKLQDKHCKTERDWQKTIVVTGQSCVSCDDFKTVDEQSCAFYRNGYCSSCNETGDNCDELLLPYLIEKKCPSSHPQVVRALTEGCEFDLNAPQPSARSLNGAQAVVSVGSTTASLIVMSVTLVTSLQTRFGI